MDLEDNIHLVTSMHACSKIHPLDLKNGVTEALVEILKPAREYFRKHPQLLGKMMNLEVTR